MRLSKHTKQIVQLLAVVSVAIAVGGTAGAVGTARGDSAPPPGWSADDWAALSPDKQQGQLQLVPAAGDAAAKTAEVDANPDPGPDAAASDDAAADGSFDAYTKGIQDSAQSPLDASVYQVQNSWSDLSPDGHELIYVYAGENVETGTGMLVVRDIPWPATADNRAQMATTEYPYTYQGGPLKILAATTSAITFSSAGKNGSFQLGTREYDCPFPYGCAPPQPPDNG